MQTVLVGSVRNSASLTYFACEKTLNTIECGFVLFQVGTPNCSAILKHGTNICFERLHKGPYISGSKCFKYVVCTLMCTLRNFLDVGFPFKIVRDLDS